MNKNCCTKSAILMFSLALCFYVLGIIDSSHKVNHKAQENNSYSNGFVNGKAEAIQSFRNARQLGILEVNQKVLSNFHKIYFFSNNKEISFIDSITNKNYISIIQNQESTIIPYSPIKNYLTNKIQEIVVDVQSNTSLLINNINNINH